MNVLAFGTFDKLHPGHKHFLEEAKSHGDSLTVVIALDETVRKVKGKYPVESQDVRRENVARQPVVDEAVLGSAGDKLAIVERISPDIICLGYDQQSFTDNLQKRLAERGLTVSIVRAHAFHPEKYKSSLL